MSEAGRECRDEKQLRRGPRGAISCPSPSPPPPPRTPGQPPRPTFHPPPPCPPTRPPAPVAGPGVGQRKETRGVRIQVSELLVVLPLVLRHAAQRLHEEHHAHHEGVARVDVLEAEGDERAVWGHGDLEAPTRRLSLVRTPCTPHPPQLHCLGSESPPTPRGRVPREGIGESSVGHGDRRAEIVQRRRETLRTTRNLPPTSEKRLPREPHEAGQPHPSV